MIGADGKNSIIRDLLLAEDEDLAENNSLDSIQDSDRLALPMKTFTGLSLFSFAIILDVYET